MTANSLTPLTIGEIAQRIRLIRGQRVVLDSDLAAFYGETTKRFNQQVRRNLARFPSDFMLQLDAEEFATLRLQSATLKAGRGQHRKYLPLAFTEHGAIMAATLLGSQRAIEISVHVVRAFLELRGIIADHAELAGKVDRLERKASTHERHTSPNWQTAWRNCFNPHQRRGDPSASSPRKRRSARRRDPGQPMASPDLRSLFEK